MICFTIFSIAAGDLVGMLGGFGAPPLSGAFVSISIILRTVRPLFKVPLAAIASPATVAGTILAVVPSAAAEVAAAVVTIGKVISRVSAPR